MNLIKIQAISRKEYYHLIRDFRSLYLAFIIPLLLIFLFGYALSLDVDNIQVVVVDHDQTDLFVSWSGAQSGTANIQRDQISACRQSDRGADHLFAVAAFVQFRLSRGEHARDSPTGHPDCPSNIFYRYPKWTLSAKPRAFGALAQLSDTDYHVWRAFGFKPDCPEKGGTVEDHITGRLLFPSHGYNICYIFLVTRK
jgi:hypothetical protein